MAGSPLPKHSGTVGQPRYVEARNAALFVFNSQLGLTVAGLSRGGGTPDFLEYQNAGLALASPDEITECLEKLDGLIARRDAVEGLIAEAALIKIKADRLKIELDSVLLEQTLSGKCRYLA